MQLAEIARHLHAEFRGDETIEITGIASLQQARPGELSFLTDPRYADQARDSKASALIVPEDFDGPADAALLFVADVDAALETALLLFAPPDETPPPGVHPAAVVDPSARLDPSVAVGPGAVIEADVQVGPGTIIASGCVLGAGVILGSNCRLWPNVVINHGCILGDNVIIHANSTIGTDGFGYRLVDGAHRKIPHIGTVVIEDDVEIGANSCVDRAKLGRTVIGQGAKIDNLVQIAHNVRIGRHCIVVSQVGIAGSSQLDDYVVLAGQVGISDHVTIGRGAMVGPQTGVPGNNQIPPGAKIMGSPWRPFRDHYREVSLIRKLPQMANELKQLRKEIDKRASAADHS